MQATKGRDTIVSLFGPAQNLCPRRETFCVRNNCMFPGLRTFAHPKNIMSNNVTSFATTLTCNRLTSNPLPGRRNTPKRLMPATEPGANSGSVGCQPVGPSATVCYCECLFKRKIVVPFAIFRLFSLPLTKKLKC